MDERELRDAKRERESFRRHIMAIAGVAIVVTAAIIVSLEVTRPLDHHYSFYMSFGTTNGATYTVLLPLPSDPEIRASLRVFTNVTYSTEPSPNGLVLRVFGQRNASIWTFFDTWKNLDASLTTEGLDASARPAVRVFLDSNGAAQDPFLRVVFTKVDNTWTTERTARGDVFEGWNAIEIQETLTKNRVA